MIDERTEEQASLYALGLLPSGEAREFEKLLSADAELRQLVDGLGRTAEAIAFSAAPAAPLPGLKSRILAQAEGGRTKNIIPLSRPATGPLHWLSWGLAAALVGVTGILVLENRLLRRENQSLEIHAGNSSQLTERLSSRINELRRKDQMSQMRIAMLGSLLENAPKAVAVSVWDSNRQKGVLVVENLTPLPPDKDYQLWLIDAKYPGPVDAGVFRVDEKGKVRFEFTSKLPVMNFDKIAVTQERKGGVAKPEGKMVLLGS